MPRTPALVEIHFALWGVLAVPFGFAGVFYLVGLMLLPAVFLVALSAAFVVYVSKLSQGSRTAWLVGLVAHALILLAGLYYLPRWPTLLGFPLALLNLYSLAVLSLHRSLWSGSTGGAAPALAQ